jgi:hypothetical protein
MFQKFFKIIEVKVNEIIHKFFIKIFFEIASLIAIIGDEVFPDVILGIILPSTILKLEIL